MLAHSNVGPGSRCLLVEETSGLLLGSLLARLAGLGDIMLLHDADSPPPVSLLPCFNHSPETMKPYDFLNWAAADVSYEPVQQASGAAEAEKSGNPLLVEKERKKQRKRDEVIKDVERKRQALFEGQWDSCVCSQSFT